MSATGFYPLNPQAFPETASVQTILTEAPAPIVLDDANKKNAT